MTVPPETRRANRWLLLGLILFALSLAFTVLWWMRVKIRENGGTVDPAYSMRFESHFLSVLSRQVNSGAATLKIE